MKLLLDSEWDSKRLGLNGNEASVLAVIVRCSRGDSPKGWFGTYQTLADYIPFAIDRRTVSRAVEKLLNLGLIEKKDEALFYNGQNDQSSGQNDRENAQIAHSSGQIARELAPPNNPLYINNNMNEKENATCAHTCDTRTHDPSFEEFLKLFGNGYTPLTERAARDKWKITTPLKKRKLIEAMRSGEWKRPRPDWCIMDFPEPRPEVISADEYYKRYETTEELDGWRREYRPEERRSVYIKEP